jgi:hypothetical protein
MIPQSLEEKKTKILAHEEMMARRLARRIIDKPVPPLWMVLIPIFFVFHAWKIKQYSNGLKDFTTNYLALRRQAIEAAVVSEQNGKKAALDALIDSTTSIPADARPQYRNLLSLLISHYCSLLCVEGKNHAAMIQAHYRNKSNYLLFCAQLNKMENAFNQALLQKIEGDPQDIHHVVEKMKICLSDLRRDEAGEIFS